jgi:archaellum component FlaC
MCPDILDLMARLQNKVYQDYTEIKETNMEIVNGEIRTLSEQISDLKAGLALSKRQTSSVKKRLKNERYNTAQTLKTLGVSRDKIAAATGLSPREIDAL